jgi:hypothetical protein
MIANAIPTPGQIAAAREAVSEITGMVYRLQKLLEADDAHGRSCLMTEIAPLLINNIGCLADMAEGFLDGMENSGGALQVWMLPDGVSKALKGGAA